METVKLLAGRIGGAVNQAAKKRGAGWWYGPHMAAAKRAIAQRIQMVDLVLEVRDARIPSTSQFEQLKDHLPSSRHIIVLNKMDLANSVRVKEWMGYITHQKQICYGLNSHNRDSIKKFLNLLLAHLRHLKKMDYSDSTITVLLVGVPNVGKSALVNSLHKIGRISAAEKGKLKHATVSPQPCETKNISSFKIASNPNVYVLDTPGVLPPVINEDEICSKLALTGIIGDGLVDEELAQYFLSILNSSGEYRKWADLSDPRTGILLADGEAERTSRSDRGMKTKRHYPSDHTQDFIVNDVRRTLYKGASSFCGNSEEDKDCMGVIKSQLEALHEPFRVTQSDLGDGSVVKVCRKLLNLYRTGRLGHYTLDTVPEYSDSAL